MSGAALGLAAEITSESAVCRDDSASIRTIADKLVGMPAYGACGVRITGAACAPWLPCGMNENAAPITHMSTMATITTVRFSMVRRRGGARVITGSTGSIVSGPTSRGAAPGSSASSGAPYPGAPDAGARGASSSLWPLRNGPTGGGGASASAPRTVADDGDDAAATGAGSGAAPTPGSGAPQRRHSVQAPGTM